MRTTITLDPDVASEVDRLRRERSTGVSAVVNDLIRRGLAAERPRAAFVQQSSSMRAKMDIANIAEVLETVDGPAAP